jgi:hypothetical protein
MRRMATIGVLAVLAGCATMTGKRGTGPGARLADECVCRETSADETACGACSWEHGWLMAGKETGASPVEAVPEAPAAAPVSAASPPPPPAPVAPTKHKHKKLAPPSEAVAPDTKPAPSSRMKPSAK